MSSLIIEELPLEKQSMKYLKNLANQMCDIPSKATKEELIRNIRIAKFESAIRNNDEAQVKQYHSLLQLDEQTVLTCCTQSGHLNLLKYFIKLGMKPNKEVLEEAAAFDRVNIVRYLLEVINIPYEESVMEHAIRSRLLKTVKYLVRNGRTGDSNRLIECAADTHLLKTVKYLYSVGMRIDSDTLTKLISQCKENNLKCLKQGYRNVHEQRVVNFLKQNQ